MGDGSTASTVVEGSPFRQNSAVGDSRSMCTGSIAVMVGIVVNWLAGILSKPKTLEGGKVLKIRRTG